jgi:hypothetical protein
MAKKNKIKKKIPIKRFKSIVEKITPIGEILGQIAPKVVESDLPQSLRLSYALIRIMDSETEYLDPNNLSHYRFILNLIVIAWNHSIICKSRGEPLSFESVCEHFGFEKEVTINLLEHFAKKKEIMFPNDMRIVGVWDVRFEGDNFHITAGMLSPDGKNPLILNKE